MSQSHCFTFKAIGSVPFLCTPLAISLPTKGGIIQPKHVVNCIWDTGANPTVVTQNVVDALGLIATGIAITNTASDTGKQTTTYEIDLYLSDECYFPNLTVNLGKVCDGIDCLLGLDIIGRGDFSITNLNGNTCLSFRYPSAHEIDFIGNHHKGKHLPHYSTVLANQIAQNNKKGRR
jgi:hypothetical protein